MKKLIWLFLVCNAMILSYQSAAQRKVLIGVFDGRTPCQYFANYLNEKRGPECIKIKWRLVLYKDPGADDTGTYEMLGFIYTRESPRKGNWSVLKGTPADPEAIVYQLNVAGNETIYLQKGDDNVLFFLDREKRLLIGNREFSYTLNRVNKTGL